MNHPPGWHTRYDYSQCANVSRWAACADAELHRASIGTRGGKHNRTWPGWWGWWRPRRWTPPPSFLPHLSFTGNWNQSSGHDYISSLHSAITSFRPANLSFRWGWGWGWGMLQPLDHLSTFYWSRLRVAFPTMAQWMRQSFISCIFFISLKTRNRISLYKCNRQFYCYKK